MVARVMAANAMGPPVKTVFEPPVQAMAQAVAGWAMVTAVQSEAEPVVVAEAQVQAVARAVAGVLEPLVQPVEPVLAELVVALERMVALMAGVVAGV